MAPDPEIPLHTNPRYDSDTTVTSLARKDSLGAEPENPTFEWSRRITITTEPLWLARIRRHKMRTFLCTFLPSLVIFFLAFSLTQPSSHSRSNDLKFYLGGLWKPNMLLTAGVVPKRFHSHEDYKQHVPLLAALSYGASSVDADVWEVDGKLLLGDKLSMVKPERNLDNMYIDQLDWLIKDANKVRVGDATCGVFATAPYLSLHLLVRVLSDGSSGYDLLKQSIQPLYTAGYLTTYNTSDPNGSLDFGPVTVIVTGNVPVSKIIDGDPHDPLRYIFFDAPLADVDDPTVNYTQTLSPIAAASWDSTIGARWLIPSLAKKKIRSYVDKAHARGIQARFWDTPSFPKWARNMVWQMLLDEGADWLDVNNLCEAGAF